VHNPKKNVTVDKTVRKTGIGVVFWMNGGIAKPL